MKRLSTLMLALVFSGMSFMAVAQSTSINYQAVLRDGSGNIMQNDNVTVVLTIREGSASGTDVYSESHSAMTNDYGLVNLAIGEGTVVSGSYTGINWGDDDHYLNISVNSTDMGTTQLVSVPYALHSQSAEKATDMSISELNDVSGAPSSGEVLKWDGSNWVPGTDLSGSGTSPWSITGSQVHYAGGVVSVKTTDAPAFFSSDLYIKDNQAGIELKSTGSNSASYLRFYNDVNEVLDFGLNGSAHGSAPNTGFIWQYANTDFRIGTNGAERLRIKNDGKVGIGTNAPDEALHVDGAVKVDQTTTAPDKNVVYGNSLPLAYGVIGSTGSILNDYGIASVTGPSTGEYVVTLDNAIAPGSWPIAIATPYQGDGSSEMVTYESSTGSNVITFRVTDETETLVNSTFSIVVFGTPAP